MRLISIPSACILLLLACSSAHSQVTVSGRVWIPRSADSRDMVAFKAIHVFGTPTGSIGQTMAFRTFEMEPAGWYRLTGPAAHYSILCSTPGKAMRPIIRTNICTRDGDAFDLNVSPVFDYVCLDEKEWDPKPAREYYQPFVAKGTSITSVGLKLAHDGVDGEGPGAQNLVVSVHRKGGATGPPDTWQQVGPSILILNVDCGGAKNYDFSAGWDSGEVPTVPGETYAVRLRAESASGVLQCYWTPRPGEGGCYRVGQDGAGYVGRDLWLTIAGDSDGLVIPYNKRVHREFVGETKFGRKWSQTYVARGRSLASAILYTATSGVQPGLPRQRVAVRIRKGGPGGRVVGVEKIAVGSGNFTGDASWGVFGCVWAPGEVPLVPGQTYAIEFETVETYESLAGYVNIKGMKNDCIPGFHPYPKVAPDTYKRGRAYFLDKPTDFDLDMQVVEYEKCPTGWEDAVEDRNLISDGDLSAGGTSWRECAVEPGTGCSCIADPNDNGNRILRIARKSADAGKVDGALVQAVRGLCNYDTYRLSGRVRSTWAADVDHQCYIGYDLTGQDQDPNANTVVWGSALPSVNSQWMTFDSDPIRPTGSAISVWLRARNTLSGGFPFRADFDDLRLHRVRIEIPRGE
jgi:hypothetical protein